MNRPIQPRIALRLLRKILPLLVCFLIVPDSGSQVPSNPAPKVTLHVQDMPLQDVLALLEKQIPYRFAYNSDLVAGTSQVSLDVSEQDLEACLQRLLKGSNLTYSIMGNQVILQEKPKAERVTFSGYIRDQGTGEALPQAVVFFPERNSYTSANAYGYYAFSTDKTDSIALVVSYVGYKRLYSRISGRNGGVVSFGLPVDEVQLSSIVITQNQPDDNVRRIPAGKTDLSMETVRKTTSLASNGDILGTIQMMPGVLSGLDGRPGYFIRGGNTDQNLVQLDEATLYNPVHLLGLVGVFNSSAIRHASLLKAGFPASFGDHLSSVLDVTMKEGNSQQLEGDLQAGTLTTGFSLTGPLIRNRSTFLVSARRSTIDLLLKPLSVSNYFTNYRFYDVNAKVNFVLSKSDRIYLSFYQGRDNSSYVSDSGPFYPIHYKLDYGNRAMVMRWNHVFSQKLFSNTAVTYNQYEHDVTAEEYGYYAELYSGIRDLVVKTDFSYYPATDHRVSAGFHFLRQTRFPASVSSDAYSEDSSMAINPSVIPKNTANRIAVYAGDEFKLGSRYRVYLGARVPVYFTADVSYIFLEPRLSVTRMLGPATSVKLSYTHMHQFLNRVQSYNAAFPAEVWIGADKNIKPQNSREASLGLFRNFSNGFSSSLEVYYKHMGNQVLFNERVHPGINSRFDSLLVVGKGRSYGAEFYLARSQGKLTGWLSYTLSWSKQRFDSLNMGREFPFAADRRHSLSMSVSYAFHRHWTLSSNFILASGAAFTLFREVAHDPYNPLYYDDVTGKGATASNGANKVQNNYRLTPYHRLDISLRYAKTWKFPVRSFDTEWVFSVYNAYARENSFFAYCSFDPATGKPIPVEVSFVPIIPSLTFNVRF
jgi:hypothetical protein